MKAIVTGGAGFIGSNLVERLLLRSYNVVVLDNLSSGKLDFLSKFSENKKFRFYNVDLLDDDITEYFSGVDEVWHLAANADVRIGNTDKSVHLKQNTLVTHRVLEAMRKKGVKKIIFASSSTVYGEPEQIPTPEDYSPLKPISLYGASKLASEILIEAYCRTFDLTAVVFRFANVVGPQSTHGVIYDFIRKLKNNPKELEILGNGKQKKSYIFISDCIDAMIFASEKSKKDVSIFNIGTDSQTASEDNLVSALSARHPKFQSFQQTPHSFSYAFI